MGEVTDFTAYRKKRKRKKIIRFLVSVLLICGVTYGISFLLYESGADDVEGAVSSLFSIGSSESQFPVNSPGGEIKGMFSLGGSLAVLNDTNVYFYSSGGEMTGSIQHRYQSPVAVPANSRFLLYDQGGKQYALYNKDKLVREVAAEGIIYLGDIAQRGDYAIASKGGYLTEVTYYRSNGTEVFSWESTDKLATAMSLSKDGSSLSVGCANTEGGRLVSSIIFMDTHKMEVVSTMTLEDEMVLYMEHHGGEVLVITDQQVFICDKNGKLLYSYSFAGKPLCGFDESKDGLSLLLGDFRHNRYYNLVSLDNKLKPLGETVVEQKVYAMESDAYGIYLLAGSRLQILNRDTSFREESELSDIQSIYPMGHYLFAATSDSIYKLDFA